MIKFSLKVFRLRAVTHKIITKRNKYIILLPEVPSDTAENNPLLRFGALPIFSQLTTEKCVNAIGKLIIEYESGIHHLDQKLYDAGVAKNVQNVILPLDRLSGPLDFAWGTFKMLYNVHRNESIADAFIKLHPRIMKTKREQYLSTSIYQAFKELQQNEKQLTEPVQRIVEKYLIESQFSGMELSDDAFKHFQSLLLKLDHHKSKYKEKLAQSSSMFSQDLEFDDVQNFPRDVLRIFAENSANASNGPWKLTLDPYKYQCFMSYCDKRLLRWNAWNAYNIRASASSGRDLNNSIEIEEIRHQRSEYARLLGFKSFAELSMKTKMAGSVENVMEMITTLHVKSKNSTLAEIDRLQSFANEHGFDAKIELWDVPYLQRLHKEELFNLDDALIRQYFPLPTVLNGIFSLCNRLFGITFQEVTSGIDTWHEDVTFYEILDETGKKIASFYLDPYLRTSEKVQGAWIEVGRNRSDVIGCDPLSYLIFSFYPPSLGKPALLTFEDLKLLMRKFGHLLQHSLTTIPYSEVAGLTNLEWDVVNVCPNVMCSFLKHYGTVAKMSGHVDTGKVIPPELHENLLKNDNYMVGLRLTEELYLSALDLEIYSRNDYWLNVAKTVWAQYMPFPYEKDDSHLCSFAEIFSEQYPAAYFSNLWADMIAADLFSAFEEVNLDDDEKVKLIGQRFRETYLALGGGCHPGEVFRQFRGRDPCADALLVKYGLINKDIS